MEITETKKTKTTVSINPILLDTLLKIYEIRNNLNHKKTVTIDNNLKNSHAFPAIGPLETIKILG